MKIPRFMTSPEGIVKRMRRTLRYWQGYGENSERACGPKWNFYSLPKLERITLTEPVPYSANTNYTLDEYVTLGRDRRYASAFMYVATPGKPRLIQEQIGKLDEKEVKNICDLLTDELIEDIGVKPTELWGAEVSKRQLKPPKVHYNYNKFNWETLKLETFTEFNIFVAPSEELMRKYGRIAQSNIFGYMPPRFILDNITKDIITKIS